MKQNIAFTGWFSRSIPALFAFLLFAASGLATPSTFQGSFSVFLYDDGSRDFLCGFQLGSPCFGSAQVPGSDLAYFYLTKATAVYGKLGAYAESSLRSIGSETSGTRPQSTGVVIYAALEDDLTPMPGDPGFSLSRMDFTVDINGSISSNAPNYFNIAQANYYFGSAFLDDGQLPASIPTFISTEQTTYRFSLPVQAGVPFHLTGYLSALSDLLDFSDGSTSKADFYTTARITKIQAFDQNGNSGPFSLSSASGAIYGPNGVTQIPEPASVFLGGAGLAICLWARKAAARKPTY